MVGFASRWWVGAAAIALVIVCAANLQAADAAAPAAPAAPAATPHADPLVQMVDEAIYRTRFRFLDADVHHPWQILHGVLALRRQYELKQGNGKINAIDWISNGATFKGDHWFEKTPYGGRAHPYNGVPYDFEGHVNQTLAILTMSDLPLAHQFKVKDGQIVTMADMVRHAQAFTDDYDDRAQAPIECTWTLWFLTRYLEPDAEWVNKNGEAWSMEKLVRSQIHQSVLTAPCGGTHQLFALSLARNSYLQKYRRLNGAWMEANEKIQSHIAAAQSLQNGDGSMSSTFFNGRNHSEDFNERIKASGHMLEWLMVALPEKRLRETWVRRAVESVSRDLIVNSTQPADCGPLYHALDALVLYRERMTPRVTPVPPAPAGIANTKPIPQPAPAAIEAAVPGIDRLAAEDEFPPPPPSAAPRRAHPVDIDEAQPHNVPRDDSPNPPPLPPRDAPPSIVPVGATEFPPADVQPSAAP